MESALMAQVLGLDGVEIDVVEREADLGDAGRQIGAAWRVKELVRDLVKLSPNRTGTTPSRNEVGTALAAVFEFAATVGRAFGLTNVANQQRRARYAASRSTRPHWLHRVTSADHVG
jgi:hypothetical protein